MTSAPRVIWQKASFFMSAPRYQALPKNALAEVAVLGRSNVGKSSLINAITQQKKLARVSQMPGCTQLLNAYSLENERWLIDLPGYGYARTSKLWRSRWRALVLPYLEYRQSLRGLLLLWDIRHILLPQDLDMLACLTDVMNAPIHLALSKADKLSKQAALQARAKVSRYHAKLYPNITVSVCSSQALTGIDELRTQLETWLLGPDHLLA